jgi:hypothetical protein
MIVTKRKLNTAISNDNKKTKLITDYWLPLSVTQSYSSSSSSSSSSSPSEEKRYSVDEITPTLLETWKISTKHVEDIHWFFTHRWLQVKEEEGIFLRKHVHVSRKHVHDFLDGTLKKWRPAPCTVKTTNKEFIAQACDDWYTNHGLPSEKTWYKNNREKEVSRWYRKSLLSK